MPESSDITCHVGGLSSLMAQRFRIFCLILAASQVTLLSQCHSLYEEATSSLQFIYRGPVPYAVIADVLAFSRKPSVCF